MSGVKPPLSQYALWRDAQSKKAQGQICLLYYRHCVQDISNFIIFNPSDVIYILINNFTIAVQLLLRELDKERDLSDTHTHTQCRTT
jgi:hypothetical protein